MRTERTREATGAVGAIRLDGVGMTFAGDPSVHALRDVAMDIPEGGFVAVVGPSGCGKSTLLRIVSGLLRPTAGRVTVGETDPEHAQERAHFGFVFQDPVLFPWLRAIDNVVLATKVLGRRSPVRGDEAVQRAMALLQDVGLGGFERHYPAQLSGGMHQRVSLARALVYRPPILLMDEPFGALDEFTRDGLNLMLLDVWERYRATVVFVTHSIAEALFLADQVVVLSARPGSVIRRVEVPFARPRRFEIRFTPGFTSLVAELRALLEEQEVADGGR